MIGNNVYPPLLNLKIPTIENEPYINIFNHNKDNLTYKHIIPGSYGICIIQPSGIWFKLDEDLGIYNCKCIWNLLQVKLYLPFYMTTNVSAKCYIEDSDEEEENIIVNDIDLQKINKNNTIKKTIECSCPNCDYQFKHDIVYSIKNIPVKTIIKNINNTQKNEVVDIPEEYKPYFKMISVGVPKMCVVRKMKMIGLDPSVLDDKSKLSNKLSKPKQTPAGLGGLFSAIKGGKKLRKAKINKKKPLKPKPKVYNKNQKHTPTLAEILKQIKNLRKV